jgi:hypothetical protein
MIEILSTIFGGGITGLFGSIITAFTNYQTQKMKNEHAIAMIKAQSEAIRVEAEANIAVARAETEGKIAISELDALKESYKSTEKPLFHEAYMEKLFSSKWTSWAGVLIAVFFGLIDVIKASCRPVLTYYLMGASTWITILAYQLVQESQTTSPMSVTAATELFNSVILTLLYLTTSCVSWWFCDRRIAKFTNRLSNGGDKAPF